MYNYNDIELMAGKLIDYSDKICKLADLQKYDAIKTATNHIRKLVGFDSHKTRKQNRMFYIYMHNLICAIMNMDECGFEQAALIICTATDADISTIYDALRRYYNRKRWFKC